VKAIFAVLLVVLQLAMQVGIPIHKHFCEMDGTYTSLVLKIDHECEDEQVQEALPPCCQKAQQAQATEEKSCRAELSQDDCCSDELSIVKGNFDQTSCSFDWHATAFEYLVDEPLKVFISKTQKSNLKRFHQVSFYRPPPLFEQGRDIQARHQVWLI
jgi:hypothetical protein